MRISKTTINAACPACGRRFHTRRAKGAPAPLPLFTWASRQPDHRAHRGAARVALLDTCRDAEGQPRAALLLPGRPPVVFATIAAALDAQRRAEGWR